MEITADLPSWLMTWIAAGAVGVVAIAALTRTLEVVLDLDRG